jgi:hypothetical protein
MVVQFKKMVVQLAILLVHCDTRKAHMRMEREVRRLSESCALRISLGEAYRQQHLKLHTSISCL